SLGRMATTVDDDTTKQEVFVEKSCRAITESEKRRQMIRQKGGIQTRRQKLAVWMGAGQVLAFIALCM
ncbi:hypothetical protein PENTCL1PPCAC_18368, partial [Pristionchus entomophagus]